jgi:hypothetical protein
MSNKNTVADLDAINQDRFDGLFQVCVNTMLMFI